MVTLQDMFDKAYFREATMTAVSQPLAVAYKPTLGQQEQWARAYLREVKLFSADAFFIWDAGRDANGNVCNSRKPFVF